MTCSIAQPAVLMKPLNVPPKLLMGPGPSNCPSNVLKASAQQMLGHLDEDFLKIMEEVKIGIKYAFQTANEMTFAVSGTGHCAMETAICNVIEPGDNFLIASPGIWGTRAKEMGNRIGATCHQILIGSDEVITIEHLEKAKKKFTPKVAFICHGDSSTGVLQPLEEIVNFLRYDCIVIVDCVASLGSAPIFMDKWGIDVLYSGSQKILNAPPGLSPISFNSKAINKIKSRRKPVTSFYMDALLIGNYWKCDKGPIIYHHTAPVSLVYALREALSSLVKESLEICWKRHKLNASNLYKKIEDMGLCLYVLNRVHRLPSITTVRIPDNVDGLKVVLIMKKRFQIEISGGLGSTAGKVWRIGLMGCNCTEENVLLISEALLNCINECRVKSSL